MHRPATDPNPSSAVFRQLVEEALDGVIVSRNGIVLYANRAALALLRHDGAYDLVGRSMSTFLDPASMAITLRSLRPMQATGERMPPREFVATRRDGTAVAAEISAISITWEDGEPAVLAFLRDVTLRVELRAKLERADRLAARGVLAAGIVHEINNPLTLISLAVDLLREKIAATDEEGVGLLNDIREGVERVESVVRDLRMFEPVDSESELADHPSQGNAGFSG